jgi:hypothetical protein
VKQSQFSRMDENRRGRSAVSAKPAAGPVVQTKPICVGPGEDQGPYGAKMEEVGRGRPTYEEASPGVCTNAGRPRAFVRNKANSRGPARALTSDQEKGYDDFVRLLGPAKQSQCAKESQV